MNSYPGWQGRTDPPYHSFWRMSWPTCRRYCILLLVFSTIVSTLISFYFYAELPMNSDSERGSIVADTLKTRDVAERIQRLEKHIFGKAKLSKEECQVPHDWLFPFCESKIQFVQQFWETNTECYVDRHKLKPENLCSVIVYLSEVERFCPLLPWRRKNGTSTKEPELAEMRFELDQTFIDTLNKLNLRWMRDRISRMWPRWVAAAKQFTTEGSLRSKHHVKKVIF